MKRRHLLLGCCAALGAGLFTGLGLHAAAQARNPCRGTLPDELARHDLVLSAFEGLDTTRLVDTHAHLLGTGDSGSGCTVHASLHQWWRPTELLRKHVILDAACVASDAPSIDRAYVQRLQQLAAGFPAGARWWLYAFDQACRDDGTPEPDWTTFHVPDDYARRIAEASEGRFEWVASVHPYRPDAIARLEAAIAGGAVAVKWLPSAMNIDPRDARCRAFCERLARARLPLVVHCGEEKAAPGARRDDLVNPLLVRHLLAQGATVIVAHCASLGQAQDTDRPSAPRVPAFELFARLMAEREWEGRLFGDLSAVFQRNRTPAVWRAVLENEHWHGRLLHGSDHPLPGIVPLYSMPRLVQAGLLHADHAAPLSRIREHNALLFDLVLKRSLRLGSARLPAALFEARALDALRAA
ncbi:MAG: amidohydrolase family protein [Rubrivivax sp.]|nr:amidohydrolase family protein [Rubrivivax sp.]